MLHRTPRRERQALLGSLILLLISCGPGDSGVQAVAAPIHEIRWEKAVDAAPRWGERSGRWLIFAGSGDKEALSVIQRTGVERLARAEEELDRTSAELKRLRLEF